MLKDSWSQAIVPHIISSNMQFINKIHLSIAQIIYNILYYSLFQIIKNVPLQYLFCCLISSIDICSPFFVLEHQFEIES